MNLYYPGCFQYKTIPAYDKYIENFLQTIFSYYRVKYMTLKSHGKIQYKRTILRAFMLFKRVQCWAQLLVISMPIHKHQGAERPGNSYGPMKTLYRN